MGGSFGWSSGRDMNTLSSTNSSNFGDLLGGGDENVGFFREMQQMDYAKIIPIVFVGAVLVIGFAGAFKK